jgi:hypothetical protein
MHVLKIGGNELDDAGFLQSLAQFVAGLGEPVVIVHGGGKAIADLQAKLGAARPRRTNRWCLRSRRRHGFRRHSPTPDRSRAGPNRAVFLRRGWSYPTRRRWDAPRARRSYAPL